MNREIIFKAKRVDGKGWVDGNLIHGVGNKADKMFILPVKTNLAYLDGCDPMDGYSVIPETVCQYTGLIDKNGMMIWEGDIVSCWDDAATDTFGYGKIHSGIIVYTLGCYSLCIKGNLVYDGGAVKQWENDIFLDDWCNAENIEITGNIHD